MIPSDSTIVHLPHFQQFFCNFAEINPLYASNVTFSTFALNLFLNVSSISMASTANLTSLILTPLDSLSNVSAQGSICPFSAQNSSIFDSKCFLVCMWRGLLPVPLHEATAFALEESVRNKNCSFRFQSANKLGKPNYSDQSRFVPLSCVWASVVHIARSLQTWLRRVTVSPAQSLSTWTSKCALLCSSSGYCCAFVGTRFTPKAACSPSRIGLSSRIGWITLNFTLGMFPFLPWLSPRSSNNRGTCFWSASISINSSLITLTDLCNTSHSLSRCYAAPIMPIRLVSNFSFNIFLTLIFCCCHKIISGQNPCTSSDLYSARWHQAQNSVARMFTPQLLPCITLISVSSCWTSQKDNDGVTQQVVQRKHRVHSHRISALSTRRTLQKPEFVHVYPLAPSSRGNNALKLALQRTHHSAQKFLALHLGPSWSLSRPIELWPFSLVFHDPFQRITSTLSCRTFALVNEVEEHVFQHPLDLFPLSFLDFDWIKQISFLIVIVLLPCSWIQHEKVCCQSTWTQTDAVQTSIVGPPASRVLSTLHSRVSPNTSLLQSSHSGQLTVLDEILQRVLLPSMLPALSFLSPISSFRTNPCSLPSPIDAKRQWHIGPCTKCALPSFNNSRISGIHHFNACTRCSCKKMSTHDQLSLYASMHASLYCLSWSCTLSVWVFVNRDRKTCGIDAWRASNQEFGLMFFLLHFLQFFSFFTQERKVNQSMGQLCRRLTQTCHPSPPLPQQGWGHRTPTPADQVKTGRKPSPHCKPTWCSIGATKLPPRGLGGVLTLTPPFRWTGQRGMVQSPPTICSPTSAVQTTKRALPPSPVSSRWIFSFFLLAVTLSRSEVPELSVVTSCCQMDDENWIDAITCGFLCEPRQKCSKQFDRCRCWRPSTRISLLRSSIFAAAFEINSTLPMWASTASTGRSICFAVGVTIGTSSLRCDPRPRTSRVVNW